MRYFKKNFGTLHQRKQLIYSSIEQNQKLFPIASQCKVLNVSKNAFYNWKLHHADKLKKLARLLIKILDIYWDNHGIYGSPRITAILNSQGINISQKKVASCMNLLDIKSVHSQMFPFKISKITFEKKLLMINLIKDLKISHLNQVWTTDITYINTSCDGTLFLISFIDQFCKRVVGWFLVRH